MNDAQRLLVVTSLVILGLVLAILMLDWGSQYETAWGTKYYASPTRIFVLYQRQNPRYSLLTDEMGIYTRYGVGGMLLGLIGPLCLFAAAAFVYLGGRKRA